MNLALIEPDAPTALHAPNPVRPSAFRPGRVVVIAYTPFARVRIRQNTLFGPAPERAVIVLLQDLGLQPGDVLVAAQKLGDVAILRRMPADAAPELKPGTLQPLAFVDGLSEAELAAALAAVAARFN